ncbi:MAG: hypothetical protein DRP95_02030 [Candidatus Latescibacterota bacterium]|nr:MAG: hypothetical protein DRP95_02030 [Candidatus Latescibacterota bacterium]
MVHLPVLPGPNVLMPEEPILSKSTAQMMAEALSCHSVGDRYRIDRELKETSEVEKIRAAG